MEEEKVLKKYKRLEESSLSRIWKHNIEHDCGAITAFRKFTDCDGSKGVVLSKDDNLKRNKLLTAKLLSKGYGITRLLGKYPEGGSVGKEISYFVVDIENKGSLLKDLRSLGEEFMQDSILFVPKGAINNEGNKAFLTGTNHCENNFLSYGEKSLFNKGKLGFESPIYTSFVNGKPFLFESVEKEVKLPSSGMGIWAMKKIAEQSPENYCFLKGKNID